SAAVVGVTWSSPRASAADRASGWKRDSTSATATSIESWNPVSRAARSNAGRKRAGIGQLPVDDAIVLKHATPATPKRTTNRNPITRVILCRLKRGRGRAGRARVRRRPSTPYGEGASLHRALRDRREAKEQVLPRRAQLEPRRPHAPPRRRPGETTNAAGPSPSGTRSTRRPAARARAVARPARAWSAP